MNFIMLGKYTVEAIKGISKQRTQEVKKVIENNKGKIIGLYVLLGPYDLMLIVDFPTEKEAVKTSVQLTKLTNIGFTTLPAISAEEFDKLVG
ncbi:MAG: GYD domain-containing protein [Endomicrobia bacterium]|nr:GYD domain-containing protein [Endomicrobiia bacterium]